ncbi:MAG: PaaI family thioesterase [Vicinamibacterales bacterium]
MDYLTLGREILVAQPFSRLVGAELVSAGDGKLEMSVTLRPELNQHYGFAHGGVISYLADNALTFAGAMALGRPVVTAEFKINFVRPGAGDLLLARASVVSSGRTQAVTRCDIFAVKAGDEKLCATALGTIVPLAPAPEPPAM